MLLCFDPMAWKDYIYWQSTDKKKLKKINQLIRDIERTPFTGLGKPEPLKHELAGMWSRRIDHEHRLVYHIKKEEIIVLQCRYHY